MSKQAQATVKSAEAQLAAARAAGGVPLGVAQAVTGLCGYLSAAALSKKKGKKPQRRTGDDDSAASASASAPVASDRRNVMPTEAAAWRLLGDALTLAPGAERLLDMQKATGLVIPLCTLFDSVCATLERRNSGDTIISEQHQEQEQDKEQEKQERQKQEPLSTDEELGEVVANARKVLGVAARKRRYVFHPTPEWAARLAAASVALARACPAALAADAAACARDALDAFAAVALAHADSARLFGLVLRELLAPLLAAAAPAARGSPLAPVAAAALHGLVVLPVCRALTGSCAPDTSSSEGGAASGGALDARPEAYAPTTEPGALVRALHSLAHDCPDDAVLGGAGVLYRDIVRAVGADDTLDTAAAALADNNKDGDEPAAKRARTDSASATASNSSVSGAAAIYVRPRSAQELRAIKSRFFLNYAAVFLSVVLPQSGDGGEQKEGEGNNSTGTNTKADMRMLQVVGEILEATARDGFLGMVTTKYEAQFFASAGDIAVHHVLGAMRAASTCAADIAAPALVVTQLLRLDHRAVETRIRQILGALWRCPWPTTACAEPPPFAPFWRSLVAVYRELRQLDTAFVDLLLSSLEDMCGDGVDEASSSLSSKNEEGDKMVDDGDDEQEKTNKKKDKKEKKKSKQEQHSSQTKIGPYFIPYEALVEISDSFAALLHQQALPVLARLVRFWRAHFGPGLRRAGGLDAVHAALHTRFCALWACLIAAMQLASAPPAAALAAIDPVADELRALLAAPPAGATQCTHADLAAVLCALADLRVGLLRTTGRAAYADRLLLTPDDAETIIAAGRNLPPVGTSTKGDDDDESDSKARLEYTELLLVMTACTAVNGPREDALLARTIAPWAERDVASDVALDGWARAVLPPVRGRGTAFYAHAAWELIAQNWGAVMRAAPAPVRTALLARVTRAFLAVDATPAVARALFASAAFYQCPTVAAHLVPTLLNEIRNALAPVVSVPITSGENEKEEDIAERASQAIGDHAPLTVRLVRRFLSACARVPDMFFVPSSLPQDSETSNTSESIGIVGDVCAFAVPLARMLGALEEPGCSEAAAGLFDLVCRAVAVDAGALRGIGRGASAFLLDECLARHDYRLLAVWARSRFGAEGAEDGAAGEDVASAALVAAAQARGVGRVALYGHLLGGVNAECRTREAARRGVRGCARIVLPHTVATCAADATALLVAEWNRLHPQGNGDVKEEKKEEEKEEEGADLVVLASELLRFYSHTARPFYDEASVQPLRESAAAFHAVEPAILDAAVAALRTGTPSEAGARRRLAALHFLSVGISRQQDTLSVGKKKKNKNKNKNKDKNEQEKDEKEEQEEEQQKEAREEEFSRLLDLVMSVGTRSGFAESASETAAMRQTMGRVVRLAAGAGERDQCLTTCARALATPSAGAQCAGALLLEAVLRSNAFVHHDVLRALLALLGAAVPRAPTPASTALLLRSMAALVLFTAEHVPAFAAPALSTACTAVDTVLARFNSSSGSSSDLDPNVFAELTRTLHVLLPSEDVCGPALCRTLQGLAAHACREHDEARAVFCAGCVARLLEDLAAHDKRGWAFLYAHQILQGYLSAVDHAGGRARLDAVCQAFLPGVCALLSICNDEQVRRVHYLATQPSKAYLQELRDVYQREFQYKGKA